MNRVGRYEIRERLGEGSMGRIYRALDTVLDRDVALKILSTEGVRDEESLERFYREARACAKLRHRHIVTVYDFGQEENLAFIAMELLEGSDLRRIIASRMSMALEEKLRIMASVCDGLEHAHSQGIVHRDLKPSNIFIGVDGQPRLLDFGVAHMPASSLTIVGRALGTPRYMSPEQIAGKPCDIRSDLFSTAITAFELIAGQHPFGQSPAERIMAAKPNSLLAIDPAFSAELDQLLARGLAREPSDRYRSAAEFALALRRIADTARNGAETLRRTMSRYSLSPGAGTETIMSAVLINLQKFEDAADHGNLDAARQALTGMKRAGAEDSRYAVALQRSEERLEQLEKQCLVEVRETATPRFETVVPESMPVPAVASRLEPTTQFDSPKTFIAPRIPTMPEQAPQISRSKNASAVAVRRSRMRWIVPAVLLACVGIAAFLLAQGMSDAPPPLTPVATAEVVSTEAPLFAKPDSGETAIAVAHLGEKLKVLRAPRFREQQWTEVQWPSSSRATQAAFARTVDLGRWASSDIALAKELQRMFASASYISLDPLSTLPSEPKQ